MAYPVWLEVGWLITHRKATREKHCLNRLVSQHEDTIVNDNRVNPIYRCIGSKLIDMFLLMIYPFWLEVVIYIIHRKATREQNSFNRPVVQLEDVL